MSPTRKPLTLLDFFKNPISPLWYASFICFIVLCNIMASVSVKTAGRWKYSTFWEEDIMREGFERYIQKLENHIKAANETGDSYAFQDPAYDICDEINELENRFDFVEPIFLLIERSPNIDFGGPGPFGSFLEQFYNNGYEDMLLKSLNRHPTEYTVYLLYRLCNDKSNSKRDEYIYLLKSYADNDCLGDDWKKIITEYNCS